MKFKGVEMQTLFMSIAEAAEYSGLSRDQIEKWVNDKTDPLPHIKTGSRRGVTRIHRAEFDKYVARKATENTWKEGR